MKNSLTADFSNLYINLNTKFFPLSPPYLNSVVAEKKIENRFNLKMTLEKKSNNKMLYKFDDFFFGR